MSHTCTLRARSRRETGWSTMGRLGRRASVKLEQQNRLGCRWERSDGYARATRLARRASSTVLMYYWYLTTSAYRPCNLSARPNMLRTTTLDVGRSEIKGPRRRSLWRGGTRRRLVSAHSTRTSCDMQASRLPAAVAPETQQLRDPRLHVVEMRPTAACSKCKRDFDGCMTLRGECEGRSEDVASKWVGTPCSGPVLRAIIVVTGRGRSIGGRTA
ncbi:hypothetical protein OH77DRAFT_1177132 [Trametes cingulata]|nr:hypothetical protein OH77DRAFT_1177132 [Trametes cingulata]